MDLRFKYVPTTYFLLRKMENYPYSITIYPPYMSRSMTRLTKWYVRPVWSKSSLSAWKSIGPFATHIPHCEDWSDCVDVQDDLSLRLAHRSFCWFYHAAAHIMFHWYTFLSRFSLDNNWYVTLKGFVFFSGSVCVSHMSRLMTKPRKWVCAQRRLRSSWVSAQSEQRLRCALNG